MPPIRPPLVAASLLSRSRAALAQRVVAYFNDPIQGERPVVRSGDALFEPGSVTWRVHGDVTGMLVGGVSGLLLQMLHPAVLAGVWDHSNFRADMHGRLRRTARFIAVTTYAKPAQAEAVIDRVRRIHEQVNGALPDGTPYRAADPKLLAWVHVTETTSFLKGWRRYAQPGMPVMERDRYFAEMARIGKALGADPVPTSVAEAEALIQTTRGDLAVDDRTREVAALVLNTSRGPASERAVRRLMLQAGVDLLPGWARRMHGLENPVAGRPLLRTGTAGLAQAVRWAFDGDYRRAPNPSASCLPD